MTLHATTKKRLFGFTVLSLALALLAVGCREAPEDDHSGHDHGEAEHDQGSPDTAGHDEPGHDEGQHVELTEEQRRRIGLRLATAGPGRIETGLTFPGEVVLNPDRVAHVVPRAPGIVRLVTTTMGDTVEADEVLAWLESAELAQAKLDFYASEAEVARSMVDLPRAKQIFDNVNRLLGLLEEDADDVALDALAGLEMGEYRGKLLTARAELVAAGKTLEVEQVLRAKDISSAQDLVAAQAAFQRAHAEFEASLDTARFDVLVAFGDAARARQVAEFGAVAAEQMLRLRGVDDATIQELRGLAPTVALSQCACVEADCEHNTLPSVRDRLGADVRFGWYPLRAPFAGVVIAKHLTLGERVGEEESVFVVADLSTVWVNISVFQSDLASIERGQAVTVGVTGGEESLVGTIVDVAPIVAADTRTALARVVLANVAKAVRPGLFVTVRVALPTVDAAVVVPRSAVQVLDEREVVFVVEGDGFEAVRVVLGRGDGKVVEVTSGLSAGARFVEHGAFELKAKIATSGLGAHAGHGH